MDTQEITYGSQPVKAWESCDWCRKDTAGAAVMTTATSHGGEFRWVYSLTCAATCASKLAGE